MTYDKTLFEISETMYYGDKTLLNYYGNEEVVDIPYGVTIIENAFGINEKIVTVNCPETLKRVSNDAFSSCLALKEVKLPESLLVIKQGAFTACPKLEEIFIPKNVRSIDCLPFDNCENLKNINVDKENKHFYSVDGVLYFAKDNLLYVFPSGKEGVFKVPDFVECIFTRAFNDSKLTGVIIPKSVKCIQQNAFDWCDMQYIVLPDNGINIDPTAFEGTRGNLFFEGNLPENCAHLLNKADLHIYCGLNKQWKYENGIPVVIK